MLSELEIQHQVPDMSPQRSLIQEISLKTRTAIALFVQLRCSFVANCHMAHSKMSLLSSTVTGKQQLESVSNCGWQILGPRGMKDAAARKNEAATRL